MSGTDPDERALAPALEAFGARTRAADGAFRARLRRAFVAGAFEGDERPTPELARALDAWRPPPDRGGRTAVRERFLAGGAGPARRASRRWRLGVGGALAAAAALLLVALLRGGGTNGEWRLDAAVADVAGVLVDGAEAGSAAGLGRRLRRGAALRAGAEPLRVVLGDVLVVELGPRAEARLSGGDAEELVIDGLVGALRVATGPGFERGGRRLRVATRDVDVEVVGTVFGVDVTEDYSCICCLHGSVATRPRGGGLDARVVTSGRTRILTAGCVEERDIELVSAHRSPLEELAGYW